ncbi:MAG: hypothetical protein ACI9SG_001104 [Maribacter sp.]
MLFSLLVCGLLLTSCDDEAITANEGALNIIDESSAGADSFSSESGSSTSPSGNGGEAGLVTAAEWNDLYNWTFWRNLLQTKQTTEIFIT